MIKMDIVAVATLIGTGIILIVHLYSIWQRNRQIDIQSELLDMKREQRKNDNNN
jgi:hypothetical protein